MQNKPEVRNSAIELLRIISMIMIVFHHFAIHGDFSYGATLSIPHIWYNFIIMGGKIGVNIFVLITGYFLIDNNKKIFDINKIVKFIGQVWFYSVVIYLIGILTGIVDFSFNDIIEIVFPITFNTWWFASAYFVLYLLHPFLNKLLHSIDKSLFQKLLLLLVLFWSIIPTFMTSSFEGNTLLWFITLYAIAGYIKLYGLNKKFSIKQYCLMFVVVSILTYSSSVVFIILATRWEFFTSKITYFYNLNKLTVLLISLSLFMVFANLKMKYSKIINVIASATFGVYLIHDNSIIRNLLWVVLFKNVQYQDSLFLIPYSIIVVAIVYIVCTFVELLRQNIVEKPCMKIVKSCSSKVMLPFKKFVYLLKSFIFGE